MFSSNSILNGKDIFWNYWGQIKRTDKQISPQGFDFDFSHNKQKKTMPLCISENNWNWKMPANWRKFKFEILDIKYLNIPGELSECWRRSFAFIYLFSFSLSFSYFFYLNIWKCGKISKNKLAHRWVIVFVEKEISDSLYDGYVFVCVLSV